MEYQGTGIVSKTSADSCVVSICIDGRTTHLSFKRSAFYSFGFRCEGSMDNILDEGSEVHVCYTISDSGDASIVAVWLGDKPDSFSDDECSDNSSVADSGAVYGLVGRIVAKDSEGLLVQADDYIVSVVKDVVFRDGCRWDGDSLDMDEEVMFDAVPCEPEDPAEPLYRATCAWVGQEPCVVDRFNLDAVEPDEDMELEILQRHEVYGTVVVIPNEVVALVEMEFESVVFRVMLFRNSFKPPCERIQDVVSVGDNLCMRLRYGYLFPDSRQWFAVKAAKENACSAESDARSKSDSSVASDASLEYVVLYSKPPLTGTISQLSYDSACINYKHFKIFVRDKFYLDKKKRSVGNFMLYVYPNKNIVNFEAVPTKLPGFTHEATCAWVGGKPSDNAVVLSLPPPKLTPPAPKGQVFYGSVSELFLPDMALVDIPGEAATIAIFVDNFSCKPKYRTDASDRVITNFVRLNDCVQFKLWKVNHDTVIGWDALVTSKDDWVNANGGVFVSRGPCENLEENGLSFAEAAHGGYHFDSCLPCKNLEIQGSPLSGKRVVSGRTESADAKAGNTKKKYSSFSRRTRGQMRLAKFMAKRTAETYRHASSNSLHGGKSRESNAPTETPYGSLNAKAAGTMSNWRESGPRWKAMKAAEKAENATANSLPGGQRNEFNASAELSCGSLNAKAAGTLSNWRESGPRWKAMKAAEKAENATANNRVDRFSEIFDSLTAPVIKSGEIPC